MLDKKISISQKVGEIIREICLEYNVEFKNEMNRYCAI